MCAHQCDGSHCDLDGQVLFHVCGQYGGDLQHDVLDDDGEGGGVDGESLDRDPQEADFPTPQLELTGPPTTAETFAINFTFLPPKHKEKVFTKAETSISFGLGFASKMFDPFKGHFHVPFWMIFRKTS